MEGVGAPEKRYLTNERTTLIDRNHDLRDRKLVPPKDHLGRTCDFPRECPIGTMNESFAA